MKMKFLLIIFFLLFTCLFTLHAQNETYTIHGQVIFKGKGTMYIFLVDEKLFNSEKESPKKIKIKLTQQDILIGKLEFEFTGIPAGEYGIKAFIDTNENGKLDKGLFGPVEPWGMSWKDTRPFGPPYFFQMSFKVEKNKRVELVVE